MRNLVAKQDISVQNSYPYFNTEMVTYTGIGVIEFKDASNVEVTENS